MIVVSDTSPVLSLARIGRLELLRTLYQQVLLPSAVYQELLAGTAQPPAKSTLRRFRGSSSPRLAIDVASSHCAPTWTSVRRKRSCSRLNDGPIFYWSMKDADGGRPALPV